LQSCFKTETINALFLGMISRRLIRIKIMQVIYAWLNNEDGDINKAERSLWFNIDKTYDLYHYLMALLLEVRKYADERIDVAGNKILATYEDLHPNRRFVENQVLIQLSENQALSEHIFKKKLTWVDHDEVVKKLYNIVIVSDYFKAYMAKPELTYSDHKQLINDILTEEFENLELMYHVLEEQNIFWNDDIEFVISMVLRTIERFKESNPEGGNMLPLFKNDEDREFAKTLIRKIVLNYKEYKELIEKYTHNWEIDRIALMDILFMVMAIAEMVEFPEIPLKVTLNEYIELAKYYSTNKSNEFINGILDKIIVELKENKKIIKTGRGLIGDN
jgi:transcription antitermination protein NusB